MGTRALGRELGVLLRQHRDASGLTLRQLSNVVGWSASTLSRLENGDHGGASELKLVHLLAACGVPYQRVHQLLEMQREVVDERGYWLCRRGQQMSESLRSLIFHESTARQAISYEPEVIPGMLQSESYIRALFSGKDISADFRESRVQTRLGRQSILHSHRAPQFTFFVHERALRLEVGSSRVMNEQLLSMAFITDLPNVTIRVVPAAARHSALFGGSFLLLGFRQFEPLVFLDGPVHSLFLEDKKYVDPYRALVPRIAEVALDATESRVLLVDLAYEHDRAEGIWDDVDEVAQKQL